MRGSNGDKHPVSDGFVMATIAANIAAHTPLAGDEIMLPGICSASFPGLPGARHSGPAQQLRTPD